MKVVTLKHFIPKEKLELGGLEGLKQYFLFPLSKELPQPHKTIRFVITKSDEQGYNCEIDLIIKEEGDNHVLEGDIFDFRKRTHENTDKFTTVLLIPTGISAEIGGHCGDGNPVARLIGAASDTLITHPNVVNASDINEMLDNTQYVEGSILSKFMMGKIGLQKVRSNRVLMLMDKHEDSYFNDEIINAVSSARVTIGLDCDVYEMDNPIQSISQYMSSGRATGAINGMERLFSTVERFKNDYDAIALSTFIEVPPNCHEAYFSVNDMINPWGGIEAMITHSISETFRIPCAHSPLASSEDIDLKVGIVDPRKAPETASVTYLHCILKGLHRAPRIVAEDKGITLEDVSCVIIPDGCVGLPVLSCLENDIPLIAVRENTNLMQNDLRKLPFKKNKLFIVDSYLEAVGVMTALKAGVSPDVTRRPIGYTVKL